MQRLQYVASVINAFLKRLQQVKRLVWVGGIAIDGR